MLGGAQSLHTNGLDEAYAIPSEEAMKLALRTQQVIAEETGVPEVIDPLGGSYYVEALTNRIEAEVLTILRKVDAMGGTIRAIEEGYFQREIADNAYEIARRRASGEQPVIGVNTHVEPSEPPPIPIHRVDPAVEARQVAAVQAVRARRDGPRVASAPRPSGRRGSGPRGEPHADDDRAGKGPRHAGRDRRAPPRSLRALRREAGLLTPRTASGARARPARATGGRGDEARSTEKGAPPFAHPALVAQDAAHRTRGRMTRP